MQELTGGIQCLGIW